MNKVKLYIDNIDDCDEITITMPIHSHQNKEETILKRNYENLANSIIMQALRDIMICPNAILRQDRSSAMRVFEDGTKENIQCQKYTNVDLPWLKNALFNGEIDVHYKRISGR